ncbi:MAG: site-specific tyrosine recombinase XerD [Micromonosporaceae bacterium]
MTATPELDREVRGYLEHLTVERGLARNTLESYQRDLRRYRDTLADRGRAKLGEVVEEDVAAFLAALRRGADGHPPLSAGSAARAVVAVRGLHAFALREGIAATDPAREVRPPAPPRRLPKAISVAEVERLLDAAAPWLAVQSAAPNGATSLRDRALLELLYATGARISEAVGLDVDDLELRARDDQAPGAVRLAGKGGKQRVVPVGSYARAALDAYLVRGRPVLAVAGRRGPASPAVFLNARGGRLTRQGAWMVLRAAAARAGLADVSPHTMRHSFATHMLDGGADVRVVQELLGHASVTTTQVYTLVTVDHLREVYAAAHPRALS